MALDDSVCLLVPCVTLQTGKLDDCRKPDEQIDVSTSPCTRPLSSRHTAALYAAESM